MIETLLLFALAAIISKCFFTSEVTSISNDDTSSQSATITTDQETEVI
jgi:hypothetical protein